MIHAFIGYDDREDEAYRVCRFSLVRRASDAVCVHPLKHKMLRQLGLFWRPWNVEGLTGQYVDGIDGRPFSTQFSHTRFLVPAYAQELKIDATWVLFVDCDFLFMADVGTLLSLAEPDKAVMVVQHEHKPRETLKMDAVTQTTYRRKNWSSLILWNLSHEANKVLTPDMVNNRPGGWLHAFSWLPDGLIGSLPVGWNWIEGISPPVERPGAVHYSVGGPWFEGYENCAYAREWLSERGLMHSRGDSVIMNAKGEPVKP